MNSKLYSMVGAGVSLAVFLAVGLLPAILYGGYAGVLLATGILGAPLTATLLARAIIVFGMVMGVTAVASLFAVAGGVVGSAVWALTKATRPARSSASK
jgi:hypothetical protein